MKKNWLKRYPVRWLMVGILALATLTLAFQGGDSEVDPAHYPHPTATPTLTPTPTLQACQVQQIFFDDQLYTPGTTVTGDVGVPFKVTLRVADAQGAPLIGANVDATVTQTNSVQAAAIPPLEDQSGTYDGVYLPQNAGLYLLKFSVSDFTGPRFLPCSAEATVRVEPTQPCQLSVTATGGQQINDPITLTANVTVDGQPQSGATVTTSVRRPDNTEEPLTFGGNSPYTLTYTKTSLAGPYTFFNLQASDQSGRYLPCTVSDITVTVSDTPGQCGFTALQFDQPQYTLGQTISFTSTLTNPTGITLNVTATAKRPQETPEPVPLVNTGPLYTGSYTRTTISETYEFKMMAANPANVELCAVQGTRLVTGTIPPTPTALIKVNPTNLIAPLCSLRETSNVTVENVGNLVAVDLELSYDPTVIQVIDADRSQAGVQVRFDTFTVDFVSRNEVDTRRGRIYFKASLLDGRTITGPVALIAIDWRPQRVGSSSVTLTKGILTDATGQPIGATLQNGAVQVNFVSNCRTGTTTLQGRSDHSGIIVANETGQQVETDVDGYFAIIAEDQLSLTFPGYLAGQADLLSLDAAQTEGQANNLGQINILAGDVNGDSLINILDMTYLAGRYLSTDATADLNGDGIVNILDLTLVAGNYQRRGPLTTWQ